MWLPSEPTAAAMAAVKLAVVPQRVVPMYL
jgi:hypothetical protein